MAIVCLEFSGGERGFADVQELCGGLRRATVYRSFGHFVTARTSRSDTNEDAVREAIYGQTLPVHIKVVPGGSRLR